MSGEGAEPDESIGGDDEFIKGLEARLNKLKEPTKGPALEMRVARLKGEVPEEDLWSRLQRLKGGNKSLADPKVTAQYDKPDTLDTMQAKGATEFDQVSDLLGQLQASLEMDRRHNASPPPPASPSTPCSTSSSDSEPHRHPNHPVDFDEVSKIASLFGYKQPSSQKQQPTATDAEIAAVLKEVMQDSDGDGDGMRQEMCELNVEPAEAIPRPCIHNDWDDVRQRKGVKMLRCRDCNAQWRWPRGARRGDKGLERCIDFLNDRCAKEGPECPLLHIRRSKKSLEERVKLFGSEVLDGVPQDDRKITALREASETLMEKVGQPEEYQTEDANITNLKELAFEVAKSVLVVASSSGPSTPRGTAGAYHKNGPPPPQGSRRRANTPPPVESCVVEPKKSYTEVQGAMKRFALQPAAKLFNIFEGDVIRVLWEVETCRNNTIGMVPRPRASTPYIKFLGNFTTFEECKVAAEKGNYYSFTWHSRQCPRPQWRMQGYALTHPNHNCTTAGLTIEHYDPPLCQGTITARLIITTSKTARVFGSFAAFYDSVIEATQ